MACHCKGPKEEVRKNWVVSTRCGNYSAFNGYHFTPSAYSAVRCLACGGYWRTKALYVYSLPDQKRGEL